MSEIQNDHTDIEPLSDEALEEVAGGSSSNCCSCVNCSGTSGSNKKPEPGRD